MNDKEIGYFEARPALRLFAIVAVGLIVAVCAFGLYRAMTAPTERTETVVKQNYSQRGDFGYAASLMDNVLYGEVTLTEKDAQLLFLRIVDDLEGTFSYRFQSDGPVENLAHVVKVEAVLAGVNWSKTFVLIPETTRTGDFSLSFPIDTAMFLGQADMIKEQIGVGGTTFDLTLNADVRTAATTSYGAINQTLVQTVGAKLDASKLDWSGTEAYSLTQSGRLNGSITVPRGGGAIAAWSVGLAAAVLVGGYVALSALGAKPEPRTPTEAEAIRAAKKHGDILVDVEGLPQTSGGDTGPPALTSGSTVVSVGSLDELVKAAETLGKPVLHRADTDRHVYAVLDGVTRYEYVASQPPSEEEE